MATRFAFPQAGTAPISPAVSALWGSNPSLVRAPLVRSADKLNTTITDETAGVYVETSATAGNLIHRQYTSEPLPAAITIGGTGNTFKLVVRGIENDAAADCSLQVHIRVLSNDGTTSRGNLYTGQSATLNATNGQLGQEFSAVTPTTRVFNNVALASINAQAGDRLCVEIGHRYHNTSTTSYGTVLTWGDAVGTADHTFNATETSPLAPWIEFSQDLFRVSTTRATSWDVEGRVSLTRATAWDVAATVTSTRATTWNVASPVAITRATSWDTQETIGASRATSWDISQGATTARATTWAVYTAVTPVTRATSWDAAARVTATRATTWAVAVTGPTVTRDTSWDVVGRVVTTRATTWDLGGGVTLTRATSWDTLREVFRFRPTTWNVDATGQVATSRDTSWDVDELAPPPVVPEKRPIVLQPTKGLLVVVRNRALQRVGALNPTAVTFTSRYCDVGDWSITVHADSPDANLLRAPGAGVMIYSTEDLGTSLLDGPVRERTLTFTEEGYELTATGPCDNVWLADKLAFQMPARTVANQGTPDLGALKFDTRSGAAETVIKGYVEANLGQTAQTARRRVTVAASPPVPRGSTVRKQARMTPLLDILKDAAAVGGIGFRVKQIGQALVFDCYTPRDRTGTVRFSRLMGNLDAFQLTEAAPTSSFVVAGAVGANTDRVFTSILDDDALAAWPDTRVERYIDQQQTEDADELNQAMLEELVDGGPSTSLAITTRDIPQIQFAKHYFVGDKVTVEPRPGQAIREVLREVTVTWTAEDGVQAVTRVGSADTTGTSKTQKRLDKIRKKTSAVNTVE